MPTSSSRRRGSPQRAGGAADAAIPSHLHDRRLLNQVRLGRGSALKAIRQHLEDHPQLAEAHRAARDVAATNEAHRRRIMWARDSKSQTRRVEGSFRDACAYTSTLSKTSTVPDPRLVAKGAERRRAELAGGGADGWGCSDRVVVPDGVLPLPGLVNELAAERRARALREGGVGHHFAPSSSSPSHGGGYSYSSTNASFGAAAGASASSPSHGNSVRGGPAGQSSRVSAASALPPIVAPESPRKNVTFAN